MFLGMMVSIAGQTATAHPLRMTSAEGETVQIFTTDNAGNIITGGMHGIFVHDVIFYFRWRFTCELTAQTVENKA